METHTLLNIIGWILLIITWTATGWIKNRKTQLIVRMTLSGIAMILFTGAMTVTIGDYINR